jgi:hypothetical protein
LAWAAIVRKVCGKGLPDAERCNRNRANEKLLHDVTPDDMNSAFQSAGPFKPKWQDNAVAAAPQ